MGWDGMGWDGMGWDGYKTARYQTVTIGIGIVSSISAGASKTWECPLLLRTFKKWNC